MTCPYLECGYNKKYKTSHNFPFSCIIHFWKALGKYFQVQ